MNIRAETMTFEVLLREIERQGVRLRVTPEGRLQAAELTPALRPAIRHHRARLKARLRGKGVRLETPSVRWAFPPITSDWLAWAPDATKEHVPSGIDRSSGRGNDIGLQGEGETEKQRYSLRSSAPRVF